MIAQGTDDGVSQGGSLFLNAGQGGASPNDFGACGDINFGTGKMDNGEGGDYEKFASFTGNPNYPTVGHGLNVLYGGLGVGTSWDVDNSNAAGAIKIARMVGDAETASGQGVGTTTSDGASPLNLVKPVSASNTVQVGDESRRRRFALRRSRID